ncbi:SMI1/KNR4 family protein [Streptomyces sp. NPDC097619]|uniref:SMI1/KNR4 family protein n=1 Tax=Streptomyces sp. NPDC097619 TaxID=3157228 RepID=UPI0033171825
MAGFAEVKKSFWGTGLYGKQDPLTDEAVLEAERELGVRLPGSLVELLRVRNGGEVADRWNAFPTEVPNSWSEDHVPLDDLMGIGRAEGGASVLDSARLVREWRLPRQLVLLSGDGHWWIALDYRACGEGDEPSVTWFDTETVSEVPLARDFRSFVESLTAAESFAV